MIVAAIVTIVFRRLKQPVVLGYILAGVIVGPHTPPFPLVGDQETIKTLSELGVIFLMFSLGLEFSFRRLREVGATAVIAAVLEILLMMWLGFQLGTAFGWGTMDSVFLGAILSISSTTIIIKALEELGKTKDAFASLIFGILVIEDILAIVLIAVLSGFATTGSLAFADVGRTMLQLSAFLGVLLVGGFIAVPRLLNWVSKFKSNEMLLITVVGLCFGVSLLAAKLGYSVALGAFIIGAIIAEARQIGKIEALMHPVRDLFSAVFFVSIGLLIDPKLLVQYAAPIALITLVVIVGKVFACSAGAFVCGNDRRTSLRVGMGLAQIGEFSFIIAQLGLTLNVTSQFLYPIAVAVSALTTLFTPYLIRSTDWVVSKFDRVAPQSLAGHLDNYTRWIGALGTDRRGGIGGKYLRKWAWQVALNFLLIAAVFIFASSMRARATVQWPDVPGGVNGMKTILWLAAMLVSLPMLIAAVRKVEAMGMLISEMSVTRAAAGANTEVYRALIRNAVLVIGCAAFLLIILLLSSTILPSWKALFASALVLVATVLLLRKSFTRIYSKAQAALRETLSQPPPQRHPEPSTAIPPMMRDAKLQTILLAPASPVSGKLIGEIELRKITGASIVGIEREGENVINPGPDEELKDGDRVLLLGNRDQLSAAEKMIIPQPAAAVKMT